MKKKLNDLVSILMMVFVCASFSACGDDGDDSASTPAELIGTWYKASGASKYSMNFTFNADGTGSGHISHNSIISFSEFAFKYSYKSSGLVECKGVRVMADENGAEEVGTTLVFQLSGTTLTLKKADNSNWLEAILTKSGYYDDDTGDDDTGSSDQPLNVSESETYGRWALAGFGKSPSAFTGSNPGEYMVISSGRIEWGGQQNGRTDYYSFTYSSNTFNLTPTSSKGSRTSFEIVSFSSSEMVLYQRSSGYYRKWRK